MSHGAVGSTASTRRCCTAEQGGAVVDAASAQLRVEPRDAGDTSLRHGGAEPDDGGDGESEHQAHSDHTEQRRPPAGRTRRPTRTPEADPGDGDE